MSGVGIADIVPIFAGLIRSPVFRADPEHAESAVRSLVDMCVKAGGYYGVLLENNLLDAEEVLQGIANATDSEIVLRKSDSDYAERSEDMKKLLAGLAENVHILEEEGDGDVYLKKIALHAAAVQKLEANIETKEFKEFSTYFKKVAGSCASRMRSEAEESAFPSL